MKAFVPTGDTSNLARLADVPEPVPAPHEAIVAVTAYSVNRGETFLLEKPPSGWRPGKDIVGRVIKEADSGQGPKRGTRVVGHPPAFGWAERVAVPVDNLVALTEGISDAQAAALPLAGLTALRLTRAAGPLTRKRILVTGASGGVGHYLTELATQQGAEVNVVTASPERAERLKVLGADNAVFDVAEAKGPFDIVYESVGGESLPISLSKLKKGGNLIWFGQASRKAPQIDFFAFWNGPVSGNIRHFDYTDFEGPLSDDLKILVDLIREGQLHPEIGLVADWTETPDVLHKLRTRGIRGNAILTVTAAT
jgi:NADPH:quinone reductase